MIALLLAARRFSRGRTFDRLARWRFFLILFLAVYLITLLCFWVLISSRDLMALMPIVAVLGVAALSGRPRFVGMTTTLAAILLLFIADQSRLFENQMDEYTTMMNQALGLMRPGEPVLDLKGETIYQRRVFYYPFEVITREQIAAGILIDTIPEDVIRNDCHVAQADGPFLPPRGRAFLSQNFVDLGRLRASGQWLSDHGDFNIAVPGSYVVLSEKGLTAGTLDGVPLTGARQLAAGPHHFESAQPGERLACLWAPAYARGYSPFHHRDKDF
jgi:hypothetical protein